MHKFSLHILFPLILLGVFNINPVYGNPKDNDITTTQDTTYVHNLCDSANMNLDSYDMAMDFVAKALKTSKNIGYKKGIALSYFYKGSVELNNDRYNDAIDNFNIALQLFADIKQYNNLVRTYRIIGNSYYFLSDYQKALQYSQKGLSISDSIGNNLESTRLKAQIGSCYEDLGDYEKSLEILLDANKDFNALNNLEGMAETLNSLGVIYSTLDQYEKADDYFHRAIQIYRGKNDNYGVSNCLTNIGFMSFHNGKPDTALSYFIQSLKIDSLRNDKYGICLCLANIGEVYLSKKDYDKAREIFLQAMEIAKEIDNTTLLSGINYQLASLSFDLGEMSEAIKYGNLSLELARSTNNPEDIINVCNLLNELFTQNGNYKKANECLSEILKLNDSVFSIKKNQEVFRVESKYKIEKQDLIIQSLKKENEQHTRIKTIMLLGLVLGSILLLTFAFIVLFIRRSRSRIRIQKKYFETLIANSEEFFIVVDDKAKMKYISHSYANKVGRKIEDRIGNSALEFIHPDDIVILQKSLKKSLETKKPLSFEFRAQNNSGAWMNLLAYAKNLMDDPDINGIVINIWNITKKKHSEKLILEKQKEIELSQKLAKLGGWKININTGTITLSKEVMILLGEKEEETKLIFDEFISGYFVEEDIEFVKERLTKAIENINNKEYPKERFEARAKRKNPEEIIHIELWAEFVENGIIHGITQDVTEKKEKEKKIIESEQSFRELFDNASDAIYILNKEGKFVDVNMGANNMYGYKTEEFVGRTPEFISAPGKNDMEMVQQCLKDAFEGKAQQIEFWGLRKNGEVFPKHVRMNSTKYFGKKAIVVFGTDISRIKEAERARLESEKKYISIFNAFQDVYYSISINGTIKEISPSVKSIFGYSQKDLIGKNSELFYNMVTDLEKIQNELIKNQEIHDIDVSLQSKEKKTIYCSLSAKLIIDEITQLPTGIEGVLRDISDRRKAEMALKVSEKKFRDIFNAFPDIYYKTSLEGIILEISPSVEKVEGIKREQIIGQHFGKYFSSAGNLGNIEELLAKNGIIKDIDLPIKLNNDTLLYCSLTVRMLFDESNRPVGAEGVIRDISDRKKIELALKESEKKYRDIFNAFSDVYYKVDNNEIISEVSPSVSIVGGYSPEDIIGTHVSSFFFSEDERQGFLSAIQEKFEVKDYNIQIQAKNGKPVDCSLNAKVIFDNDNNILGVEGVLRDISERVETHKILKKSERELKKSNETKEKILSIIGHDLLGPIGTTKGMTDIVINENTNLSKEEIVDLISSLKPSLDSTYNMVENLLAWARLQRKMIFYNPELGYIKPVIEETFSLFKVHANTKGLQLGLVGDELLSAYFDRSQIIIVIRNLISNAVKFTNRNGNITVKLKVQGGKALVEISDTGIGIPENELKDLFVENKNISSRFGTENEKGTGLGLILANEFLHQHDSELIVNSKIGKGSVFSFSLPLNETKEQKPIDKIL